MISISKIAQQVGQKLGLVHGEGKLRSGQNVRRLSGTGTQIPPSVAREVAKKAEGFTATAGKRLNESGDFYSATSGTSSSDKSSVYYSFQEDDEAQVAEENIPPAANEEDLKTTDSEAYIRREGENVIKPGRYVAKPESEISKKLKPFITKIKKWYANFTASMAKFGEEVGKEYDGILKGSAGKTRSFEEDDQAKASTERQISSVWKDFASAFTSAVNTIASGVVYGWDVLVGKVKEYAPEVASRVEEVANDAINKIGQVFSSSKPAAATQEADLKLAGVGLNLHEFMADIRGKVEEGAPTPVMPPMVSDAIEYIRKNGLEVEGVFRVQPGSAETTTVIQGYALGKRAFADSEGTPDVNQDVYTAAKVITRYLDNLPGGLLPDGYAEPESSLAKAVTVKDPASQTEEEKERGLNVVFNAFDGTYDDDQKVLMLGVVGLASEIAKHSDKNRMDVKNLTIVLAPNCQSSEENPLISVEAIPKAVSYLTFLTDHFEKIRDHVVVDLTTKREGFARLIDEDKSGGMEGKVKVLDAQIAYLKGINRSQEPKPVEQAE